MTAAWAGLAREAGWAALPTTADLLLNPALTAARILAETPEAIPTLPSFRIPEFADLEPLARAVGADPQAHLAAVQGLATHRADISDASAAAPLGPGAQIAAVAALTGKALADAAGALNNLEEELNRVAQRLVASTAAALAVPLPGGSASGQLATEALAGLARTAQPYAAAAGFQLPPAPVPATVPAAHRAASAPAAPVAPPPQVAPAPAAGSPVGAAAVAAAKSQLGTPYVWGGSRPGGFDCSGLTSWAYRQAGVELPRTAASQAVGRQVAFEELLPGDLVLWEGHAAMYAGDGMMIEAGDPVQLNPVRTSNLGMAFLGFWRPTG